MNTVPIIGFSAYSGTGKTTDKGLPGEIGDFIALVTDDETLIAKADIPCFALDDIEGVAEFILRTARL